jgi:hypothetical protein
MPYAFFDGAERLDREALTREVEAVARHGAHGDPVRFAIDPKASAIVEIARIDD